MLQKKDEAIPAGCSRKRLHLTAHFIVLIFLSLLALPALPAWAVMTSAAQAKAAVEGWLSLEPAPMGKALGNVAVTVTSYAEGGQTAYYVVRLEPHGLVVVPADDTIEPIIAFTDGDRYDPAVTNPFGALVSRDMAGRMALARRISARSGQWQQAADKAQAKWNTLIGIPAEGKSKREGEASISDVLVAPLLQSTWGQDTAGGVNTYNLFTPNNYVCGCVATAMAQLMRFHRFPTSGVGTATYGISICGASASQALRGGDDNGGAYGWANMPLSPNNATAAAERQAIGRLSADAGASVNMDYCTHESGGSGAYTRDASGALRTTFQYASAVSGYDSGENLHATQRSNMINTNLDAGFPVLLSISDGSGGHAIVCDGYGYDSVLADAATPYHHLNMGWSGYENVWYNLPTIDAGGYEFRTVTGVVYNVFPAGKGEIISGRVTDYLGKPVSGITVTASQMGTTYHTATTNEQGIYALVGLWSDSRYVISAATSGHQYLPQAVTTGSSENNSSSTGNRWGVDFQGAKLAHFTLPDTGQTKCYGLSGAIPCPGRGQELFGQDANYTGRQPSYRRDDDTVTDLVTGLMWQQADDGMERNWYSAFEYCSDLELGGFTDWRLPTRRELLSIIDAGRLTPGINPVFSISPGINSPYRFWTSNDWGASGKSAWTVLFYMDTMPGNGYAGSLKTGVFLVRCVRGGQ